MAIPRVQQRNDPLARHPSRVVRIVDAGLVLLNGTTMYLKYGNKSLMLSRWYCILLLRW